MIFENVNGRRLLWNGSWNATGQASLKNSENVMVVNDPEAIAAFEKEYSTLRNLSSIVTSADCITPRDREGSNANFARRMNGIPEVH